MEKYLNKIDKIEDLLLNLEYQKAKEKLEELKNNIIYDMAIKNSKSYQKEQLKYAKMLLDSAKKVSKDRTIFHKMYKIDDTYQLCNGFVAVVLKDKLEGLELNTEDCRYYDCRNAMKISNGNYFNFEHYYQEVTIDILELEQQAIRARKIKDTPLPIQYAGNVGKIYYNPIYMLMAIKILGTKDVKVYMDIDKGKNRDIYLSSDIGKAIVIGLNNSVVHKN